MTGFGLDPEALEGAIKELETARARIDRLGDQTSSVMPEELVAQDATTQRAFEAFKAQATSDEPWSLRSHARAASQKLTAKIDEYRASLEEYRRAEDSATVDAGRINREA